MSKFLKLSNNEFGIFENTNNELVVSSRVVARKLGKEHNKLVRDINNIVNNSEFKAFLGVSPDLATLKNNKYFIESHYINEQNKQKYREYLLTKRGFTLYVMNIQGFNIFKMQYIEKFEEMQKILEERNKEEWLKARKNGKLIRRETTDVIKNLIELATQQGASTTKFFYSNYTKLAKKYSIVEDMNKPRDEYTENELYNIGLFEDVIQKEVVLGINSGLHYKVIFQKCKEQCILLDSIINKKVKELEIKENLKLGGKDE